MRYFLALEFDAGSDAEADALLGDIVETMTLGSYAAGHGCVRQLEGRGDCPECGDPLELGEEG